MTSRRDFLFTAAAAAVPARPKPANVLVLMSDEHNPRFSQPYGHPFVETPHMARLARAGTVFENAYCPSPLCLPSRSAFLSGRRVFDIQTYGNCNVIQQGDYPSYGKVLAGQGVHTVHIGKTDVYAPASSLGFSEMILPGDRARPGDTFISRKPFDVQKDSEGRAGGFGPRPNPFAGELRKVNAAIEWLSGPAKRLDKPWTLAVNLTKPHFPHYVTADLWERYAAHADLPAHGMDNETARHPYAADLRRFFGTESFSEDQIRNLRRGYYGCVTWLDSQLGRLLDALDQSGLASSTVVAYTSDHGEMLGEFGLWWKRSLYEDSVRIPMIVAGPGFAAGRRVRTPVDLHDLQASLFHSTGGTRPAEWVGRPLQSLAANDDRRAIFAEFQGGGTRASGFLLRQGRWKLLYNCEAPHQLFDLESKAGETVNLAGRHADVVRRLEKDLRGVCDPEAENRRAEEFIARQLRALGR